jgi:hypothetical protein
MVSPAVEYINGAKWLDIAFRTGGKTAASLTEADWMRVAGFEQGTLTPTGEAATTNPINYEDSSTIVSYNTRGTVAFEGDLPDFSSAVVKLLLKTQTLDTSTAGAASWLNGRAVEMGGKDNEVTANVFLRLPVVNSPGIDYMLFFNATIVASYSGPTGSVEDITKLHVAVSCLESPDPDSTQGQVYGFVYKTGTIGLVPPTSNPTALVLPQGGTTTARVITFSKALASLTAAPSSTWLTIAKSTTPADGTSWTVTATRNDTGAQRQAVLVAVGEDTSIGTVPVSQAAV